MYYLIKHLSIIYRWYNSEHALLQYSFASSSPGQIKQDYDIGIFNFSTNHAVLMSKSKDWLAQNQDNVSSGVSTRRLLFQRVSTTKIQFSVLDNTYGLFSLSTFLLPPHIKYPTNFLLELKN
jgi:hypothetical protein